MNYEPTLAEIIFIAVIASALLYRIGDFIYCKMKDSDGWYKSTVTKERKRFFSINGIRIK